MATVDEVASEVGVVEVPIPELAVVTHKVELVEPLRPTATEFTQVIELGLFACGRAV